MKLIFKSLINNDAAIEGGRKRKWWIAPLLLLFSLIVSVVPTFVGQITAKGSGIVAGGSVYGMDYAFEEFLTESNGTIDMVVQEDKSLKITGWAEGENYGIAYKYLNPDFVFVPYVEPEPVTEPVEETEEPEPIDYSLVPDFIFFNIPECDAGVLSTLTQHYPYSSIIVFGSDTFNYKFVNPNGNRQAVASAYSLSYAYKNMETGYSLIPGLLLKDVDGVSTQVTITELRENLFWLLDQTFDYQRVVGSWIQTGIFVGVNLLVVLLMGLMVWILTRGKNNPYRMYTFWDGLKIAFWCSTAPAILTVPLGFLLGGSIGQMLFPLLIGIRVMWLTMKSLRPDGTGYQDNFDDVKTVKVKKAK